MNLQASLGPHRYSDGMTQRLTPGTVALLVTAPLLWAGNAVVGRLVHDLVPPITLNFLRWVLALALLLPLTHRVLRPDSPLWPHWRRYALLGLLGVGLYNALQYLALQTSTPINVTLVGSSMPVWMLAVGALFFGVAVTRRQLAGAAAVHDRRAHRAQPGRVEPAAGAAPGGGRSVHAAGHDFMVVLQLAAGAHQRARQRARRLGSLPDGQWCLAWPGRASLPAPNGPRGTRTCTWGWPLVAALLFIAIGPALVAYRCWGMGVQRAGPAVARVLRFQPHAAVCVAAAVGRLCNAWARHRM
jgi:drug/metabolite transporter (DMT)-like permease